MKLRLPAQPESGESFRIQIPRQPHLSGSNRDGADGIAAIKRAGGITVAQDPSTAEYRIMPQAAIDTGCVDITVPLDKIGQTLTQLFAKGKPKHG